MADEENEDELTPTRGSPLANGETMTNNTSTRMNNTDPPLHPNQNFHSFSQLPFTNQHNNNNTSNLLTQILQNRTIQYADQIFCLSDYDIIMELVTVASFLSSFLTFFLGLICTYNDDDDDKINLFQNKTLVQLKNIFNECQYARNVNDQSVVELVLSRITAAIRSFII